MPVLLLKTKSAASDAYENLFNSSQVGECYSPTFVPVLRHAFDEAKLTMLASLLIQGKIGTHEGCEYGGLIFTSQRAVEAFVQITASVECSCPQPLNLHRSWLRRDLQ